MRFLEVRRSWRAVWLVAASLVALVLPTIAAQAADPPSPAQGIQISPVLIDLNADKGNSYNLKITVTNVTTGDLVLKQQVNDFRAKDETGNPEVILDDKNTDPTFSFKSWVSEMPSLPLKAKESKVVTVAVNVPSDAESGGHYGVIRFSGSAPGEENANVTIAASVGVLVLTRVNGTISEKLTVKDFFVEKNGSRTSLAESGPVTIVERLENNGNVHVKPTGTVTVKNMFGGTVLSKPLSEPARNVLPNSTRRFTQDLENKWLFGRYTARLETTYGYSKTVLSSSFSFWIIPYKLICLSLLALVLIGLILRKLIARHNEKVIKKALNRRR